MRKIIRKLVEIEFTWKILHFFYLVFYRFKFEKDLIPIEIKNNEMAQREVVMEKSLVILMKERVLCVGLY